MRPWTAWLKIAHTALAIVFAAYLAMVATNSFLFGYNFWNDPPPSDTADLFAVVSLWVLFLAASFIGAVAYTAMCELASDTVSNRVRSLLRRSALVTLRRWWIAVPGFALTMLACVFFLPGIFAVALLGPLPLQYGETHPRGQVAFRIGIGAVVALVVASTVWVAVLAGGYLVSRFDGPAEGVAALLA